ncbi:MAG: hypothetical protein M9936_20845 [Caldilinea sp.]|nr:hypothetical protein [Caldilinea sp.]
MTTYGYEGWGNLVQETLTGFSQQEEHMNTIYSEMLQALLQFKCTAQEYRQIVKPYLTRLDGFAHSILAMSTGRSFPFIYMPVVHFATW